MNWFKTDIPVKEKRTIKNRIRRYSNTIQSKIKSYDELPLFINAKTLADTLGISISSAYELMTEKGFPSIRIGKRLVVQKEKFISWINGKSGGNKY